MLDQRILRRTFVRIAAGGIPIGLVCTRVHLHTGLQWLGLALACLGLTGILVAQWTLGSSFSITPQAKQLVTRGIYSKIRNPIYISGTIFIAGLILILRRPWLWGALVVLTAMQIVRARAESKVLEARFGHEYLRYRDRTWF